MEDKEGGREEHLRREGQPVLEAPGQEKGSHHKGTKRRLEEMHP